MRIGGHLNWVFNVLPLGRPALTELYRKIAGKNIMGAGIALNADVVRNIEWLIAVIPKAIGVHFIDATRWDDRKADFVLWTDASLRLGLAFLSTQATVSPMLCHHPTLKTKWISFSSSLLQFFLPYIMLHSLHTHLKRSFFGPIALTLSLPIAHFELWNQFTTQFCWPSPEFSFRLGWIFAYATLGQRQHQS
jgi:hypothetical protein